MIPLFIDGETTGATNDSFGSPFNPDNRLVYFGYRLGTNSNCLPIEFAGLPYGHNLSDIREKFQENPLVVGFNTKFDLHWLRRYSVPYPKVIWDCQYAQYCIWRQKRPYPSLNDCLKEYGYPLKLDIVETEYWNKEIDTDQVPEDLLVEYLEGDLVRTQWVFEAQCRYLADKPELLKLIQLGNMDILVTAEMEWNGIYYNNEKSIQKGNELNERILNIDRELDLLAVPSGDVPTDWNSNDFVSCVLYGGLVKQKYRETYEQVLKSGEVKKKERWAFREVPLPTLVKPLAKTKLAKEGFYATSEDVLIKLKAKATKKVTKIIDLLLERSKLEKLVSTYYHGFPKIYQRKNWVNDIYHPNLNHVKTRTGRLSSTDPNGQNIPDSVRELIESGYSKRFSEV